MKLQHTLSGCAFQRAVSIVCAVFAIGVLVAVAPHASASESSVGVSEPTYAQSTVALVSIHEVNKTIFGVQQEKDGNFYASDKAKRAAEIRKQIKMVSTEIARVEKILEIQQEIANVQQKIADAVADADTNTNADPDEDGTDSAFGTTFERNDKDRESIHAVNLTIFGHDEEKVANEDSDTHSG